MPSGQGIPQLLGQDARDGEDIARSRSGERAGHHRRAVDDEARIGEPKLTVNPDCLYHEYARRYTAAGFPVPIGETNLFLLGDGFRRQPRGPTGCNSRTR